MLTPTDDHLLAFSLGRAHGCRPSQLSSVNSVPALYPGPVSALKFSSTPAAHPSSDYKACPAGTTRTNFLLLARPLSAGVLRHFVVNSTRIRTYGETACNPFRMRSFKTHDLKPFRMCSYKKNPGGACPSPKWDRRMPVLFTNNTSLGI
jgi:hypothetical protein